MYVGSTHQVRSDRLSRGNQMGISNFSMISKRILLSFQYINKGEKTFWIWWQSWDSNGCAVLLPRSLHAINCVGFCWNKFKTPLWRFTVFQQKQVLTTKRFRQAHIKIYAGRSDKLSIWLRTNDMSYFAWFWRVFCTSGIEPTICQTWRCSLRRLCFLRQIGNRA